MFRSFVRRAGPTRIALLAFLLLLGTPATAFAHAYPVGSSPTADATVATAPATVDIWFGERLEPRLSSLVVYNAERQPVQSAPSRVDPRDPTQLAVAVEPDLPNGTYTVVWHVVSADDGHGTAGVFAFGIGEAPGIPVVSAQELGAAQGGEATPAGVLGRWLTDLSAVLILGIAAFVLLIARHESGASGVETSVGRRRERPTEVSTPDARDSLGSIFVAALLLLLVGQILRAADELSLAGTTPASAASLGSPGTALGVLLFSTRFGTLWLVRSALLVLGAGSVVLEARAGGAKAAVWFWVSRLAIGIGLVTDLAWSGHAAAGSLLAYLSLIQATLVWTTASSLYLPAAAALVGIAKPLTLVVDWLHLAGVSVWVGGVIALAVLTWDSRGADRAGHRLGAIARRFSRVAVVGIVVVLLTGLYNTWLYLAGPRSYVATGYGESLLLKHLVIVALLLAAALNHFVSVPLLADGKVPSWLPLALKRLVTAHPFATIRLEAGLGLIVLLSTGLLTSLAPARSPQQVLLDPTRELSLAREPFQETLPLADGSSALLAISPGRVGPNVYTVRVERDGVPVGGVRRAFLEFSSPDLDPHATNVVALASTAPGTFSARGLALSAGGIWNVGVRIDRSDGRTLTAQATMQVGDRWAAAVDPGAKALLARAATAMAAARSARMIESLSDGAGGLQLDQYTFVAPNREQIVSPGGGATLQIGTTVYHRDGGHEPWHAESGASPYEWPADDYSYLIQGVGAIDLGDRVLLGHPCEVVAFYAPRIGGVYEEWIGNQDGLIRQEVMAAPVHYMVNLYDDFDRPISILPPT